MHTKHKTQYEKWYDIKISSLADISSWNMFTVLCACIDMRVVTCSTHVWGAAWRLVEKEGIFCRGFSVCERIRTPGTQPRIREFHELDLRRVTSAPSCHSHIHPRSHIHQVGILICKSTILRLVGSFRSYYRFLIFQTAWLTWLLIQIYILHLAYTCSVASYFLHSAVVLRVVQMQEKCSTSVWKTN